MEIKKGENEIVDYLMENYNSTDTEVKLNYLRLILKKYNEERNEHS
jgi:hypothetical protein